MGVELGVSLTVSGVSRGRMGSNGDCIAEARRRRMERVGGDF